MERQRHVHKMYWNWLQTQYAHDLAARLLGRPKLSPADIKQAQDKIIKMREGGYFMRTVAVPYLWDDEAQGRGLREAGLARPIGEKGWVKCRCSPQFHGFLKKTPGFCAPKDGHNANFDPTLALTNLVNQIWPGGTLAMFHGDFTPACFLHKQDFILDKAFVAMVITASKWLTAKHFPEGLYGKWPPAKPSDDL